MGNTECKTIFRISQRDGKINIQIGTPKVEANYLIIELVGDVRKNAYEVLDALYDDRGYFNGGFCKVKMGGKWGFVNTLLERVVDTIYDNVADVYEEYSVVSYNGYQSYLKMTNTNYPYFLLGEFDNAENIIYGIGKVQNNDKYGAFSVLKEKLILECQYEGLRVFYNDNIAIKQNEKWGLANDDGKILVEPIFDTIAKHPNKINKYLAIIGSDEYIVSRNGEYQKL